MSADLVIAMIEVKLNYEEQVAAAKTGFLRETYYETNPNFHDQSMRGNLHEAVYRHAEAAGSELAAAKYFDIPNFKLTINTFKKVADVGNRIEIKHTIWKEGHLIIRERDRNDDLAVLVTGKSPNYFIVGWLPISICKSERFKHKDGSWWISQINLRPMGNLKESIYGNVSV
jgi:hypothetical protein